MGMTPGQAARAMRKAAKQIDRAVERADARLAGEAFKYAVRLSSGPHKTKELRKIRPGAYSTKRAQALYDPTIINEQSGAFKRGWRRPTKLFNRGMSRWRLINNDSKADMLAKGTPRMRARNIKGRVEAYVRVRRERVLRQALKKFM